LKLDKVEKLISRKELIGKHPVLGERRYRLDWLIRTRQIPIVKFGRIIFFDEKEILEWINNNKIPELKVGKNCE